MADRTELEMAELAATDRHAIRAVKAVRAFADAGKAMDPREPIADIIADLLTDLQYLAREAKLSWPSMLAGATENFTIETAGEAPMVTSDGVTITDGMRVWDYNLRAGTVDLSRLDSQGWFNVKTDNGDTSYMNAERVCVRHPFTGKAA